ncbi:TPA: hypothetical protein N3A18_000548 [Salmonella enterica subsp. arizonae serovar 56:z4,z23:-]|nr:hypothetical protein [Salmonella enterica]EBB1398663.1 hypothetical protein [Salmonella enterica]EKH2048487.1 hypothetical protein [Salmonella enterica]HCM1854069.1 hypothetical protein [Salmonella enterica subsp. arizonae serovar 56:z4,z23:-]
MSYSSGFAEGLNSVNNIWRTVNNMKYQDESNSLRQADQVMRQREFDQNNKFRQDSLNQQKQFHTDEMGLRNKEMQIQQQNAALMQQFRKSQEAMQRYQQQMSALQPVYQGAIQILANGGTVPGEILDKLSGTPFDLGAMSGVPYRSAVKSITDALNKNPDQLNSSDNLRNLNTVLAPELKRGVGDVDPGTGKKIAKRKITGIIPSPDGKLISPKIRLTYSDGSTAEGPLSKFGSTHPDDPLIAIPKEAAGQQMFARAAASALISSSPNAKALGGTGKNTVRQAVAGKIADLEEKRLEADSKIRTGSLGTDDASQKKLKDDIEANDKQYQDLEQHLYSVYGVNPAGSSDGQKTGNDSSDPQRQKLMADKDYPGFKQAMEDKKWDVDKLPAGQLSDLLGQYKQSLEKSAKATSMADQMRQGYKQNGH